MTQNQCVVCGRPTPDGWACVTETERARQQLAEIAELTEAARAVMYRQTSTTGAVHSTPGPRDLLDYGAGQRLMNVQIALTGWGRMIAEERGVGVHAQGEDMVAVAARYVAEHLEWCRHKAWVDELLREVGDCAVTMRSIVATPAGRVYLGVCGAPVPQPAEGVLDLPCCVATSCEPHGSPCCHHGDPVECPADPYVGDVPCDGDVYGRPGADTGRCKNCGAEHEQEPRRRENDALVTGKGFRASVIAHAYGISANTIRGWAWVKRDAEGNALNDPKLKPVGHDQLKRPLYLVADVLALEALAEQRRKQRAAQGAGMGATA